MLVFYVGSEPPLIIFDDKKQLGDVSSGDGSFCSSSHKTSFLNFIT